MSQRRRIDVVPVTQADVPTVAQYLHANLNEHVSPTAWRVAIEPTWQVAAPNHGFMLSSDEGVKGVYLAIYSERAVSGKNVRVCNLAAWCVDEEFRFQGIRLLRALLAQEGYLFTDLSPSGNVVALNQRLGFELLDTATDLVPNLPWPLWSRRTKVVTGRVALESILCGRDLEIYRDHAKSAAAVHLVVSRGSEHCYVIFRRDRRKNLPLFASILYVGNPELFDSVSRHVSRHLLLRRGVPLTLAERRVVGNWRWPSLNLGSTRPKMFKGDQLSSDQIDYLYSELTCLTW